MNTLAEQLLAQPQAVLILQEVQEKLEYERKQRQQFYRDINEQQKTEYINGEIIVHSPVKKRHNQVSLFIAKLLSTFVDKHELGFVGIEKIMISLTRNDYEPDICFFSAEKAKAFLEDQVLFPAPDLVVEVLSESTKNNDRGIKFKDYEAHGIREYWIVDPEKEILEQYHLQGEQYELSIKAGQGSIKSHVVANFEIPIRAIFDKEQNIAALQHLMVH